MTLDVRTMYMAMAANSFIVAMALFISHAGRFRRDGTLAWTVGWVFQGAFWTLLGLRGVIWDFVSIVVANTFLATSFSLLYAAVREFQGRAYNLGTLLLPPVAAFVFFWYFSTYVDNLSYRIVFISLLTILQITAIARALFRDTPIQQKRSCRLTGFAFLVMAALWFIRLLEGFTVSYAHLSVLEATTFRNASVMAALGTVILSGIGFVFMIRERAEEEREKLVHELQDALANVKTLRGLLPICSYCKKIRDDKGYWNRLESYIRDHSGAEFTHGMCPECLKKLYPDLVD